MHVKMKNSAELCIFIQRWRTIACSGAVPEKLFVKQGVRVFCDAAEAACERVAMAACAQEDRAASAFRKTGVLPAATVNTVAFAFLASPAVCCPLAHEMRFLFAQGLAWQGGGLGLPCVLSRIEVLEGTLCARGVRGFGCDRYILVLGWPCRENKECATPKA